MSCRSRWYTDELTRASSAACRIAVGPKRWRTSKSVHLESDGCVADVQLLDVPAATSFGGTIRRMACPICSRPAQVLAAVPGEGWCCRRCGGWRSRERSRIPVSQEMR